MLNEIYSLNKSLEKSGIILPSSHPWVKKLPRRDGFIIGINNRGFPETLEFFNKESSREFWKIEKNNHITFPAFRLTRPLIKVDDISRKKIRDEKDFLVAKSILEKLLSSSPIDDDAKQKAYRSVAKVPVCLAKGLRLLKGTGNAFETVINRLSRIKEPEINDWLVEFARLLLNNPTNKDSDSMVKNTLIGNKYNKKKRRWECDTLLFLDVSDYLAFNSLVRSIDMHDWILNNLDTTADQKGTKKGKCAFSGNDEAIQDQKFPNPCLPKLGQVYLFSQNISTPCQTRYHKAPADAFPISRKLVEKFDKAMKFITGDDKEDKNWIGVPDGRVHVKNGKKIQSRSLLISYLLDNPVSDIENALLLGGETSEDLQLNYESKSSSIISALKGLPAFGNQSVRCFIIRKADLGRGQVILSDLFSVNSIINSNTAWLKASKNYPHFKLKVFKNGVNSPLDLEPIPPFPMDLVSHLQHDWTRTKMNDNWQWNPELISGCQVHDGFEFFLRWSGEGLDISQKVLHMLLKRSSRLLIGLGNAIHADYQTKSMKEFNNRARLSAMRSISLLSIALFKLGYPKEVYMKSASFLVGRLLSTVDCLHKEYCKLARKKDKMPSQLIGNALVATAMESPERALSLLLERIRIYQGWANTVQGSDEIRLAKWCLKKMGQISNALSETEFPKTMSDENKAQLLLGYLAMSEGSDQSDQENQ